MSAAPGGSGAAEARFAPASPIGRLLDRAASRASSEKGARFVAALREALFEDPFQGTGGFGASSAQFALACRALARADGRDVTWQEAWALYRELTSEGVAVPPSGADVIAQWEGGVTLFDPAARSCEQIGAGLDPSVLLVFSAAAGSPGRKVATHDHLAWLGSRGLAGRGGRLSQDLARELERPLRRGIAALRAGDARELGASFEEYALVLGRAELEAAEARADREALRSLPGVVGAKGCGAMLADAVIVAVDPAIAGPGSEERATVLEAARARGLRLVADGIPPEAGVREESP